MACRCSERAQGIRRAVNAVKRGEVSDAAREIVAVGESLAQDVRSGDLRKAGLQRLAQMRGARR